MSEIKKHSEDLVILDINESLSISVPKVIGITKSEVGFNEIRFYDRNFKEWKLRFQLTEAA